MLDGTDASEGRGAHLSRDGARHGFNWMIALPRVIAEHPEADLQLMTIEARLTFATQLIREAGQLAARHFGVAADEPR